MSSTDTMGDFPAAVFEMARKIAILKREFTVAREEFQEHLDKMRAAELRSNELKDQIRTAQDEFYDITDQIMAAAVAAELEGHK